MATTIKIRGTSNSDEPITLVGRATKPLTRITALIRSRVIREIPLPIESVTEEPEIVFTAQMTAPGQLQESQSTQLSVDLFSQSPPGGPLTLVEPYDAANWDKAIVSGGASATLGGVNGDLLTATATLGSVVVEFTYNVAGSPALGTIASATVEVVATPTFEVVLTGLPASAVQDNVYTLGAQRRDPTTNEVLDNDPANFTFAITVGVAFGSIINGNQLSVNPSTAGNSITVRATHNTGGEFDDGTTNIIVQPTFADNEPEGMTPTMSEVGSTKLFTGWNLGADWQDDNIVSVVADPSSKFGQTVEKRWTIGDSAGWHGFLSRNIGLWNELYFRFVFALSPNYELFSQSGRTGKFVYFNKPGDPDPSHVFIISNETVGLLDFADQYVAVTNPADHQSTFAISKGVYHTLEVHIRASLTPNTGFCRMWLDDTEYTHFTHLGHGAPAVQLVDMTWKTTANAADKRIGDKVEALWFWGGSAKNKSVKDSVRFSEIYISGKN